MSEEVEIYGFGSYFFGMKEYNDIDILIVHRSSNSESCRLAIMCKQYFVSNINDIDVTILSQHEERQISFVEMSSAKCLGKAKESCLESDLDEMLNLILSVRNYKDDVRRTQKT